MSNFYEQLDRIYAEEGGAAAEAFLRKKAADLSEEKNDDGREYLLCMSELGGYLRATGRYGESLDALGKALSILLRTGGAGTSEHATSLINIATTYRMAGDYEKALSVFMEADDIFGALPDADPSLYAGLLNNVAILSKEKGEPARAADTLMRATDLLRQSPGAEDELATALANLASVYLETDNEKEAVSANKEALELFESLPYESVHYPAALNNAAVLSVRAGDYETAANMLEKALPIIKAAFGENEDHGRMVKNLELIKAKAAVEAAEEKE